MASGASRATARADLDQPDAGAMLRPSMTRSSREEHYAYGRVCAIVVRASVRVPWLPVADTTTSAPWEEIAVLRC